MDRSVTLVSGEDLSFTSSNQVCRPFCNDWDLLKGISTYKSHDKFHSSYESQYAFKKSVSTLSGLRFGSSPICKDPVCNELRSHLNRGFYSKGSLSNSQELKSRSNSRVRKDIFNESFCDSSLLVPSIFGSAGSGLSTHKKYLCREKSQVQKDFSLPGFEVFASSASPLKRATCNPEALLLPPLVEYLHTDFSSKTKAYRDYISLKNSNLGYDYLMEPGLMIQRSPLPPRTLLAGSSIFESVHNSVEPENLDTFEHSSKANDLILSETSKSSLDLGIHGSTMTSVFSRYPQNKSCVKRPQVQRSLTELEEYIQSTKSVTGKFQKVSVNDMLGPDSKAPLLPKCFSGKTRAEESMKVSHKHNPPSKPNNVQLNLFLPVSTPKDFTVHRPLIDIKIPASLEQKILKRAKKQHEVHDQIKPNPKLDIPARTREPEYFHSKGKCVIRFYFRHPKTKKVLQNLQMSLETSKPRQPECLKKKQNRLSHANTSEKKASPGALCKPEKVTKHKAQEFRSFQATAEELANAKTTPNIGGPRQGWQDTPGCWTCRVRRKLCPQDAEFCLACFRLKLFCDRSEKKPNYMSHKELLMKARRSIRDITDVGRREALRVYNKAKSRKSSRIVRPS